MRDAMRWRYGETNPVVAAVDAETEIAIGDLLFHDADRALPAGAMEPAGSPAADRAAFAGAFLGVAMQRSPAGAARPIRVATTGVFELDCDAMSLSLGDLVGAAVDAGGGKLRDQAVMQVTASAEAIGRVARREPAAVERALIDIRSTVMTGGVSG